MPRVTARLVGGAAWTDPLFTDARDNEPGVQATVRDVAAFEMLVDTSGYECIGYVLPGVVGARLSSDGETYEEPGAALTLNLTSIPRNVYVMVSAGEIDSPTLVVPPGNCTVVVGPPLVSGYVSSLAEATGLTSVIKYVTGVIESFSELYGNPAKNTEFPLVAGSVSYESSASSLINKIKSVAGIIGFQSGVVGDADEQAPPADVTGTWNLVGANASQVLTRTPGALDGAWYEEAVSNQMAARIGSGASQQKTMASATVPNPNNVLTFSRTAVGGETSVGLLYMGIWHTYNLPAGSFSAGQVINFTITYATDDELYEYRVHTGTMVVT